MESLSRKTAGAGAGAGASQTTMMMSLSSISTLRIHPVDLEAGKNRLTAPLVPGGSFRSDKGDTAAQSANHHRHHQQQQQQRAYVRGPLPPAQFKRLRGRGYCCWFLCGAVISMIVLAVLAAAAAGALDPMAPRFSVVRLAVFAFAVDPEHAGDARAVRHMVGPSVGPSPTCPSCSSYSLPWFRSKDACTTIDAWSNADGHTWNLPMEYIFFLFSFSFIFPPFAPSNVFEQPSSQYIQSTPK